MVGLDFIICLVFSILGVQLFALHIKGKGITVDTVQVIFLTGNQPAIFIKNGLPGIFVMLEHKIALSFSIVRILTGDMFQDCHEKRLLSLGKMMGQKDFEIRLPFSELYISFHKYLRSPG